MVASSSRLLGTCICLFFASPSVLRVRWHSTVLYRLLYDHSSATNMLMLRAVEHYSWVHCAHTLDLAQTRDDSWDFKSDGLDGWDSRSGGSRSRSQDLDAMPTADRLPSVGEAAFRVDTAAADERIFTKVRPPLWTVPSVAPRPSQLS